LAVVSGEVGEQRKVVPVDGAGWVPGVEADLLVDRQTGDRMAVQAAGGQATEGVVEPAASQIVLAAVAGAVEGDRMQVHPVTTGPTELGAHRSPVGVELVAERGESVDGRRLVASVVDGQVEVAVWPGLVTRQRVDSPSTADPRRAAAVGQHRQHDQHLADLHRNMTPPDSATRRQNVRICRRVGSSARAAARSTCGPRTRLCAAAKCTVSSAGTRRPRETLRMAYDVELADRIRAVVQAEPGLAERRMFGGLAFLIHGNMAVSASGQGGLLLRVDPAQAESLIGEPHVRRFEMRGREMDGWLRVDAEVVEGDDDLRGWVRHGVTYARSLRPK